MKRVFATVLVALLARATYGLNLSKSFELQHSAGYGPLANIGLAFKF